jgi:hypothetical protein
MTMPMTSLPPDAAMRRYVELLRADLEPDPLFRRRLRGRALNRFVAAREGMTAATPGSGSRMGRLGRACLYATFALALSVGGTLAASRGAVPGDLLYPVKLQVEAIRLRTFPAEFRDDLLVYSLTERMAEYGRLVEEGELDRAAGMDEVIGAGYVQLAAMGIDVDNELTVSVGVLKDLADRLPAPAQAAIDRALENAPGLDDAVRRGRPSNEAASADENPAPGVVAPAESSPRPDRSAGRPDKSHEPAPTASARASQRPERDAAPEPDPGDDALVE